MRKYAFGTKRVEGTHRDPCGVAAAWAVGADRAEPHRARDGSPCARPGVVDARSVHVALAPPLACDAGQCNARQPRAVPVAKRHRDGPCTCPMPRRQGSAGGWKALRIRHCGVGQERFIVRRERALGLPANEREENSAGQAAPSAAHSRRHESKPDAGRNRPHRHPVARRVRGDNVRHHRLEPRVRRSLGNAATGGCRRPRRRSNAASSIELSWHQGEISWHL